MADVVRGPGDRVCLKYLNRPRGTIVEVLDEEPVGTIVLTVRYRVRWDDGSTSGWLAGTDLVPELPPAES